MGLCPDGVLLQRSRAPLQKLYLFHPSYTNVLLELRNSTDQIIAFDGKSPPSSPPIEEAQEDTSGTSCTLGAWCWVWWPLSTDT